MNDIARADGLTTSTPVEVSHTTPRSDGFILWAVSNSWQRTIRAALEPLKLTYVQFLLLDGLACHAQDGKHISQASLARWSTIDEMMTSQVLRTLESKGLVDRQPHPTDLRAKILRLTPEGRAILPEAAAVVAKAEDEFFAAIGPETRGFLTAIERLASDL